MVAGLDKFREYFAGHEDRYVIIGGVACHLLFDEAGLEFRGTKDIDMVLCVEVMDSAFGKSFLSFLSAGGYRSRERGTGDREFYRFHKPDDPDFPFMIELFSRRRETIDFPRGMKLTRVPVEDDVVSLSAILLDENYYQAIQTARKKVDGVAIIDETLLIPFKARAFLDFTARRESGEKGRGGDIRKHRNDVFRLAQLLREGERVKVPDLIREDIGRFVGLVESDETLDPKTFGVAISRDDAIALIRSVYGIE